MPRISTRLPRRAALLFVAINMTLAAACSDTSGSPVAPAFPTGTSTAGPDTSRATPAPVPPVAPVSSASALAGATLWVDPQSRAAATASSWRASRPADAAQLDKIAAQPQAQWFGNWNTNIAGDVAAAAASISAAGAVPVFVAYNIPQRDCGGLSGGNDVSVAQYKQWVAGFAAGLGSHRAVVILEPDALANMDCLSATDQQTRLSLIAYAVATLGAAGTTAVYIDAGHAGWQSASTMASRLNAAGVAGAAGFSLNISNFVSDADNVSYGHQLSALTSGKHFVIDSSRNGLGPTADAQWCNPSGRALGTRPTTRTGIDGLDAFLWIKPPGESDGACNGGPSSGTWWPEYALGLAQRAAY